MMQRSAGAPSKALGVEAAAPEGSPATRTGALEADEVDETAAASLRFDDEKSLPGAPCAARAVPENSNAAPKSAAADA